MSTYTPELVRAYVDDLDALFREAVASQRLQETFEREKKRIVSFNSFYIFFFLLI
jgi:hypothetical protein